MPFNKPPLNFIAYNSPVLSHVSTGADTQKTWGAWLGRSADLDWALPCLCHLGMNQLVNAGFLCGVSAPCQVLSPFLESASWLCDTLLMAMAEMQKNKCECFYLGLPCSAHFLPWRHCLSLSLTISLPLSLSLYLSLLSTGRMPIFYSSAKLTNLSKECFWPKDLSDIFLNRASKAYWGNA